MTGASGPQRSRFLVGMPACHTEEQSHSEPRIQPGFTQREGSLRCFLFGPSLDGGARRPREAGGEFSSGSGAGSCRSPLCMGRGHPLGSLPDHWGISLLCRSPVAVALQWHPSGTPVAVRPAEAMQAGPPGPTPTPPAGPVPTAVALVSAAGMPCLPWPGGMKALWYFAVSPVPSAPCLSEIPQ